MNKLFFPQVAEQTIYFLLFAEQSFFSQKPIALQESNGRPLINLDLAAIHDYYCLIVLKYEIQVPA